MSEGENTIPADQDNYPDCSYGRTRRLFQMLTGRKHEVCFYNHLNI
jgi:hypothetical protein